MHILLHLVLICALLFFHSNQIFMFAWVENATATTAAPVVQIEHKQLFYDFKFDCSRCECNRQAAISSRFFIRQLSFEWRANWQIYDHFEFVFYAQNSHKSTKLTIEYVCMSIGGGCYLNARKRENWARLNGVHVSNLRLISKIPSSTILEAKRHSLDSSENDRIETRKKSSWNSIKRHRAMIIDQTSILVSVSISNKRNERKIDWWIDGKQHQQQQRITVAMRCARASLLKSTASRFVKIQYSFIFSALLLCDKDYYSKLNWLVTGAVHIHSFFLLTHARRSNPLSLIKTDFVRSFVCLSVCSFIFHVRLAGAAYAILCVQRAYWFVWQYIWSLVLTLSVVCLRLATILTQ